MKKILALWTLFLYVPFFVQAEDVVEVQVINEWGEDDDAHYAPSKMICLFNGDIQDKPDFFSELVQDLEMSAQLSVNVQSAGAPAQQTDITKWYKKGYPFAVFITFHNDTSLEARLYDTLEGRMLLGKKWHIDSAHPEESMHSAANDLWYALFGQPSSFGSMLAYVKRDGTRRRSQETSLWITDIRAQHPRCIVKKKRHIVAPAWSVQASPRTLYFSEFTERNVRLCGATLEGRQWSILERDGTTVGVTQCAAHLPLIYCCSGALWSYEYDAAAKKSIHTCVVKEEEPCACPAQLENGDIVYCTQGTLKQWHAATKIITRLPISGYCTAPCYAPLTKKIVYSSRIAGTMQLMTYDCATGKVRQITFDAGDKVDPCWSPCGVYIAFCKEQKNTSVIYILNTLNGSLRQLTADNDVCISPAWSFE